MVVSNTSPIINLASVGLLDLLPQIYTTITIPQAVYTEVTVTGRGQPGAAEAEAAAWVVVQPVTNTALVQTLLQHVNPGEAEAIALSVECSARVLLIDERKGRALAAHYGIAVTGLLGVLTIARQRGLMTAVKPTLDDLRRVGFWIDQRLYEYVLHQVGET
jgi:hypothetical protein